VSGSIEALHRDLHERNVDFLVTWGASHFADEQVGFETPLDDLHVAKPLAKRSRKRLVGVAAHGGHASG
jgi:hypothetical protein